MFHQPVLATVAQAAAAGDELAWRELVRRMDPVLRRVARGFRLSPADVDEVVQTTWLRAIEHLGGLDEPAAVGGWLVVVARREALRTYQRGVREVLTDDLAPADTEPHTPETLALAGEVTTTLTAAVRRLPGRQRDLLGALLRTPEPSYRRLSADLAMPIGSIGPTRDRALARLRCDTALAGVAGG